LGEYKKSKGLIMLKHLLSFLLLTIIYNTQAQNVGVMGYLGINLGDPQAPLQFDNSIRNRKIVLWDHGLATGQASDDHRFFGFGINDDLLRYQTITDHVFYATAVPDNNSKELLRIKKNGDFLSAGSGTIFGRLLVGTLNPQPEWLYVSGTARISGDLTVDGATSLGYSQVVLNFTMTSSSVTERILTCPVGSRVISGGGGHRDFNADAADITLSYSGPDINNPSRAWRFIVHNAVNDNRAIRLMCTCARVN
jgi:hypothetical protein